MEVEIGNSSKQSNSECLKKLVHEFRQAVLPVTVFVCVEAFLGLLFNLIVIFVFFKRNDRCTFRCFILFLSFIDILSCFTAMTGEVLTEMFWFNFRFPTTCRIKSFFNIFTVNADVLCLLTIAIDRYKQSCLPDTAQISKPLAMYMCAGIFLVSAGVATPGAIVGGTYAYPYVHNGTVVDVTVCGHRNNTFESVYVIFLQSMAFLSLAVMLLLYILIARRVICQTQTDMNTGSTTAEGYCRPLLSDDRDGYLKSSTFRRQTIMMFLITSLFIATVATYLTLELIISRKLKTMSVQDIVKYSLVLRLYFINHVINPLIYGCMDPQFRFQINFISKSKQNSENIFSSRGLYGLCDESM